MKKLAAACALFGALIACVAGTAGAHTTTRGALADAGPITFGVADDAGKFADDGGAWFDAQLKGANLTQERWTLTWSPDRPTAIDGLPFLERAAPQAQADGIRVALALYGRPASANDPDAFCTWAGIVAQTVQAWGIHDYIVWNEPNTALYWSPQDATAPARYEALLARCYDALHAADPEANVIGFGLSPRDNGPSQTAPIPFIKGVGDALRASGRTTRIMDEMSIHPYPNPNNPTDSPDVGYKNPDFYGIPNLDRVKQAVYDAFKGTGQPTTVGLVTARRSALDAADALQFVVDEVGWQTDTTQYGQYVNQENVPTVSEDQQTQYLRTATEKYFTCDPTVASVNWFLLVDETYRNGRNEAGQVVGGGWQSGLLTAGGEGVSTPKEAYAALASDWAAGRDACKGREITWTPADADASAGTIAAKGGMKGAVCRKGQRSTKRTPCRTPAKPKPHGRNTRFGH